jgi:hypothetical protein
MSTANVAGVSDVTTSVRWVAAAGLLCLVSACTSETVGGTPEPHVTPGTIQASFLSIDEVSTALGSALTSAGTTSEPPPAFTADPAACAVAVGPGTQSVYARGWTAFWSETFSDVDSDHTVTQVLGVYPDGGQASKVFGTLTDGVKGCPSAVRTDGDQSSSKWTYAVDTTNQNTLAWTATQDAADGWACYRQARLKDKAVLQVAVCEAADGKQATAKIADQFAAKVGG